MAYKDSSEIASDSSYALGEYSFRIERTSVPGSSNDKIEAICTKGGKNARKSIQVPSSTQLSGWFVEANETEATVYAIIATQGLRHNVSPGAGLATLPFPNPQSTDGSRTYTLAGENGAYYCGVQKLDYYMGPLVISETSNDVTYMVHEVLYGRESTYESRSNMNVRYNDKLYYFNSNSWVSSGEYVPITAQELVLAILPQIIGEGEAEQIMIGRFAIDLEDAGGDGPGSDWDDPGDYDPDWEEGDPTHTLYVEVTGALSGRHNDPIVDPSYSYIPADKDTVKDYGCGGDGGHGGGGGAGASTVVVHKFATNQANSKEVTAIARRHGYGSGGGKGGKGGDGCILVYY